MSLEDQYDAWVRGLLGGSKSPDPKQAARANDVMEEMQARLDALTDARSHHKKASDAVDAVQKAGARTAEQVRQMSSELTQYLRQDGLLGGTVAGPPFSPPPPSQPQNTPTAVPSTVMTATSRSVEKILVLLPTMTRESISRP